MVMLYMTRLHLQENCGSLVGAATGEEEDVVMGGKEMLTGPSTLTTIKRNEVKI